MMMLLMIAGDVQLDIRKADHFPAYSRVLSTTRNLSVWAIEMTSMLVLCASGATLETHSRRLMGRRVLFVASRLLLLLHRHRNGLYMQNLF